MSEVMNRRQLLASLAIVAALALVGAVEYKSWRFRKRSQINPMAANPVATHSRQAAAKTTKVPVPVFILGREDSNT